MLDFEWKLGKDLIPSDNLLDGFLFDDVINALRMEREVNHSTARVVLNRILKIRMQDMNFLFDNNIDQIIELAMKGRS